VNEGHGALSQHPAAAAVDVSAQFQHMMAPFQVFLILHYLRKNFSTI
jgi:hypothetical protein